MSSAQPLSGLFVPHLPEEMREAVSGLPDLETHLILVLLQARAAWPGVVVKNDVFLAYLARRVPVKEPAREALREVRTSDLYLACACFRGDAQAIQILDRSYFPKVEAALLGMGVEAALRQDIKQIVYRWLLVKEGEGGPHIEQYAGRGDLQSWLRAIALREARHHLRKENQAGALDYDALIGLAAPDPTPETAYIKQTYRSELRSAFQEAAAALSSRDRDVLRRYLIEHLSIDQIGAEYDVHRTTVARWLVSIREQLLSGTRQVLMQRLRITATEVDGIMNLVQSSLHVSLHGVLFSPTSERGPGSAQ